MYDAGVALTLARFVGFERLPYRDLWTLYGPGPPVLGSAVMRLFGPSLGPQRIAFVLVQAAIVAAAYLVARRFVPRWVSAVLAALVAMVAYPSHFQQSIALLLWGLWLVLRASDDPERAYRRLLGAALLFGLSFWGRFELVPVGLVLVVVLWISARGRVEESGRRTILLAGVAPTVAFLVYVLAVVGWDRAWLNLIDYPFLRYSHAACRGLPPVWSVALEALAAPLRGRVWTAEELGLWTTTFLPPVLGILCLIHAHRRRRADPLVGFAAGAIGALTIVLWLEHRPRAGLSPGALIPLMVVAAAVLLGALAARRPGAARWSSVAVSVVIGLTLASANIPFSARAWTDWPAYHPMLGWADGNLEGLYDERVYARVVAEVRGRTAQGEEIFVALTDNSTRHHANAPIFYWFTDRPPASRFIEFDPCLTDTDPVQREIVSDLAPVDVVVATTFFPDTRVAGSSILDGYLGANFTEVYRGELPQDQAVLVLERTA